MENKVQNMGNKRALLLLLAFAIPISLLPTLASAQYIGVGLRWDQEAIGVPDLKETCTQYYIYNPFDTDVVASIKVEGDISGMVTRTEPAAVAVPAKTMPRDGRAVKVCFSAPTARFPPFMPAQYKGKVLASYAPGTNLAATGSAVGASVQAPLSVFVGEWGMFSGFITAIGAVATAIGVFLERRKLVSGYRTVKLGREKAGKISATEKLAELKKQEQELKKKLGKKK
ncbi:MAG: hypothetical protein HY362_02845 [Candidatus Aenigmarchaeota archaeon]|nr:hypothetical protein [Candidatus Aenigmarchaeota archaeon]